MPWNFYDATLCGLSTREVAAVTKTRTGLGLDWRWTGDGLEHFSFLTHLNNHF